MVTYVRAECLKCNNTIVLTYEEDPAPPVEKGDFFRASCPVCEETTTLKTIGREP